MSSNCQIRSLEINDYHRGFLVLLSQLTTVGEISFDQFEKAFFNLKSSQIYVIEDQMKNCIIASGTLLLEQKFIHQCGLVGHIEDIVTDIDYRGQGLGKQMILYLTQIAKEKGCYKVILNCHEKNIPFYEKCGFNQKEIEMVKYLI